MLADVVSLYLLIFSNFIFGLIFKKQPENSLPSEKESNTTRPFLPSFPETRQKTRF